RTAVHVSALGVKGAEHLRAEMLAAAGHGLNDSDDARLWLDVVRHETGEAVDLVCDLRILADLHRRYRAELTRSVAEYDVEDYEQRARVSADMVDARLAGPRSSDETEEKISRAWPLFVMTYDEVWRAARLVVTPDDVGEFAS